MVEHTRPWCASTTGFEAMVRQLGATSHRQHKAMQWPASIVGLRSPHFPLVEPTRRLRIVHDGSLYTLVGRDVKQIGRSAPLFNESALVHIYTRSLADVLVEAVNTKLHDKKVSDLAPLQRLIRVASEKDWALGAVGDGIAPFPGPTASRPVAAPRRLLDMFIGTVGLKAALPLGHALFRWPNLRRTFPHLPVDFGDQQLARLFDQQRNARSHLPLGTPMCDGAEERRVFKRTVLSKLNATFAQYERVATVLEQAYRRELRGGSAELWLKHFPRHNG
mmetsp:Transcript_37961/g.89192  ORF Transcript_37961/g.89192 Transcript_37961/m.89192 type:complete len:277 (+) Transcript_37961:452-1282(+)